MMRRLPDPPRPAPGRKRFRRTDRELAALRLLAREAALRGEPLASIRARLQIPESTLTGWARADGYRKADLAARAEAAAEAEAGAEAARAAAARIRQEAEELWREGQDGALGWRTPAQAELDLARARAFALIEAGLLDAAEEEAASVRRLARLLAFARPVAATMGALHRRAEWEAETERIHAVLDRIEAEADAERAARRAAGLPEPPEEPDYVPLPPEVLEELLERLRADAEAAARWKPWHERQAEREGAAAPGPGGWPGAAERPEADDPPP